VFELEVIALDVIHRVSTPADLAEVLRYRIGGGNHFEVAVTASAYPMLDVLVQDQYAVVHYWSMEGIAGDQAVSTLTDAPAEIEFSHSDVLMPGSVVIDVETANACVEQFAETLSRPTVVEWTKL
jgi:Immunity protein Imm1